MGAFLSAKVENAIRQKHCQVPKTGQVKVLGFCGNLKSEQQATNDMASNATYHNVIIMFMLWASLQ